MKPSPIYNSEKLQGRLIGQPSLDTNKPLMSAEMLADSKDFPKVTHFFWLWQYQRGDLPAFCCEN
jgi:hypothetical protein